MAIPLIYEALKIQKKHIKQRICEQLKVLDTWNILYQWVAGNILVLDVELL